MSIEINKLIHTEVLGRCWHEPTEATGFEFTNTIECAECRILLNSVDCNPDYCTDRNAAFKAIKKCVDEKGDPSFFGLALFKILVKDGVNAPGFTEIAMASPEQQMRAVLDCDSLAEPCGKESVK